MQTAMYIPPELHNLMVDDYSISGAVRQLLARLEDRPELVAEAFMNRTRFRTDEMETKRYVVYMTDDENVAAQATAKRFLLSLNLLIRILLEDAMFQLGKWPPALDKFANKDYV